MIAGRFKPNAHRPCRATALLGDNELQHIFCATQALLAHDFGVRIAAWLLVIVLRPVCKDDRVGVLLDRATVAQVC
jgi:hypothetical protein